MGCVPLIEEAVKGSQGQEDGYYMLTALRTLCVDAVHFRPIFLHL